MSIDIRNIQSQGPMPEKRPADASDAGESRARGADTAPASDQIALSDNAQRLKDLAASAQSGADVDAARVESIRRQIAEGRYHVDAAKLAGHVIDLERELLG